MAIRFDSVRPIAHPLAVTLDMPIYKLPMIKIQKVMPYVESEYYIHFIYSIHILSQFTKNEIRPYLIQLKI